MDLREWQFSIKSSLPGIETRWVQIAQCSLVTQVSSFVTRIEGSKNVPLFRSSPFHESISPQGRTPRSNGFRGGLQKICFWSRHTHRSHQLSGAKVPADDDLSWWSWFVEGKKRERAMLTSAIYVSGGRLGARVLLGKMVPWRMVC